MLSSITFAVLAAFSFGIWTVFHKLASPYINQAFGAILVSLTAVIFGSLVFLVKFRSVQLFTDVKGLIFIVITGIFAFLIDFLALQAYSKGLPINIGGPIIIGGSIAVAVAIGLFLGETMSVLKFAGLALLIAGAALLAMAN